MKTIKIILNKDNNTYDFATNLNLTVCNRFEKIEGIIKNNCNNRFNIKNDIIKYVRSFIKCLDYIKVNIIYV